MVTWIFDLRALIVGFVLGMFVGAFIFLFIFLYVEMRDGGAWDKGFSAGFDLKCKLEDAKNVLLKVKEDGK